MALNDAIKNIISGVVGAPATAAVPVPAPARSTPLPPPTPAVVPPPIMNVPLSSIAPRAPVPGKAIRDERRAARQAARPNLATRAATLLNRSTAGSPPFTNSELSKGFRKIK